MKVINVFNPNELAYKLSLARAARGGQKVYENQLNMLHSLKEIVKMVKALILFNPYTDNH